jgi:hypothetical protein
MSNDGVEGMGKPWIRNKGWLFTSTFLVALHPCHKTLIVASLTPKATTGGGVEKPSLNKHSKAHSNSWHIETV